jgi:hypothetical protein
MFNFRFPTYFNIHVWSEMQRLYLLRSRGSPVDNFNIKMCFT